MLWSFFINSSNKSAPYKQACALTYRQTFCHNFYINAFKRQSVFRLPLNLYLLIIVFIYIVSLSCSEIYTISQFLLTVFIKLLNQFLFICSFYSNNEYLNNHVVSHRGMTLYFKIILGMFPLPRLFPFH